MRFDTPVYFQTVTPGEYNPDTGNYEKERLAEEKRYADVTDSGVETMKLVYGTIKQGSMTIRLQTPFKKPYDSIRIGDKRYHADFNRRCKSIVVSEVQ